MSLNAFSLRTITLKGQPMRLFRSPLDGPDYPRAVLADLLTPGASRTDDFRDYADRLTERPEFARYMLTDTGLELLVSAFVVDGILDHQAEQGSDAARRARIEFSDRMAEAFASQHTMTTEAEFRRICVIAAARRVPAIGQA